MKPRIADLFCGAGGAGMGYSLAGFEVVGVDVVAQPRYPFAFVQADALTFDLDGFDAVHASPPCQAYTHAKHIGNRGRSDHPDLIEPTRALLMAAGLPWVIENVPDSPLRDPVVLCGSSLGLPDLERHRWFETSFPVLVPGCAHGLRGAARFPGTPRSSGARPLSRIVNQMASGTSHAMLAEAMGIDWMPPSGFRPTQELRNAVPPAYTQFLGSALLSDLSTQRISQ